MTKNSTLPPYGPPLSAPPSYAQVVGGVSPTSPFIVVDACKLLLQMLNCILIYSIIAQRGPKILTTIVPVGPESTHMICPHCHAEIDTTTKTEPGLIAYILGTIICLIG